MSVFRIARRFAFVMCVSSPAIAAPPAPSTSAPDARPAPSNPPTKSETTSFAAKLGLGGGVPYGTLGGGLELGHEFVTATAGVGTTVFAGMGWAVGGRVYFTGNQHKWRPFVQAVYGTTAVYSVDIIGGPGSGSYAGTLNGLGVYAGLDHDVGSPGGFVFSYGVGYVTHADLPANVRDAIAGTGQAQPDFGLPIKFLLSFNYDLAR